MARQARCVKCKQFDDMSKMVALECNSCLYCTYRHKHEDCGGVEGALRSIRGHFTYFLKRADGDGGHTYGARKARKAIEERLRKRLL